MPQIPAYCPHCGTIFPSAFEVQNSTDAGFSNGHQNCPRCGKMANIADGVFNATGDLLTLVSGPQITRDILAAFAKLVEEAREQKLSLDELKARAEKLSPRLGEAVERLRGRPVWWTTAVLILFVTALKSCHFELDAKVDVNRLFDQAIFELASKPTPLSYDASAHPGERQNPKGQKQPAAPDAAGKRTENKD